MRQLLIAINLLLIVAILGVVFLWHPEPEELPLPGTYAEKLGRDVRPIQPVIASAAGTASVERIEIIDAHVPLLPPGVRTGAAYMRIRNGGDRDMALVAAASPAAAAVELHAHVDDNGVMRMRRVTEIVVPAQGEAALQTGGYHVMLIDLKAPLKAGDRLAITLNFASGGDKTVEAIVR